MWIVALALRRPYTFVVMALLIIILTCVTIPRTPVDIFPDINIPVVSVVWNYTCLLYTSDVYKRQGFGNRTVSFSR